MTEILDAFIKEGKAKEVLFAGLIGARMLPLQDDLEGCDLELRITFDVKGRKRIHREDEEYTDDVVWVELMKDDQRLGWVAEGAVYLVFEQQDSWIVVMRERLFDLVRRELERVVYPQPTVWAIYQRGRSKLTLVPTAEILDIATMIINKK